MENHAAAVDGATGRQGSWVELLMNKEERVTSRQSSVPSRGVQSPLLLTTDYRRPATDDRRLTTATDD